MADTSLADLIGAALSAVVRADAQAAMTTLEYVERVGFVPGTANQPGTLRMVAFEYDRTAPDGTVQRQTMRLPLLSLLPIPTLHVEEGDLEFSAKITGLAPSASSGLLAAADAPAPAPHLLATLAPSPAPAAATTSAVSDAVMQIKVKLRRSDLPGGTINLLGLMSGLQGVGPPGPAPQAVNAPLRATAAVAPGAAPGAAAEVTPSAPFTPEPNESYESFVQRYQARFQETSIDPKPSGSTS